MLICICNFSMIGLSLAALIELAWLCCSTISRLLFKLVEWRCCVTRIYELGVRMEGGWVMFLLI